MWQGQDLQREKRNEAETGAKTCLKPQNKLRPGSPPSLLSSLPTTSGSLSSPWGLSGVRTFHSKEMPSREGA